MQQPNGYKYWAFISYSHQDNVRTRAAGRTDCVQWADWLHGQLETYHVPPGFREGRTTTGEAMPEQFFPSFRMVGIELDGLPASGSYSGLMSVNGRWGRDLPGVVHGKVVNDAEQHDLGVTVRLLGTNTIITVTLDAQPLYDWSGPAVALSSSWHPVPGAFSLGTYAPEWVVYEATVKRQ